MSILYKEVKDVDVDLFTAFHEGRLMLNFSADCGKFGTNEALDSYALTPKRLLAILQEREDITDEEMI